MKLRPSIIAMALIAGTSAATAQDQSRSAFSDPNFLGKLLGRMNPMQIAPAHPDKGLQETAPANRNPPLAHSPANNDQAVVKALIMMFMFDYVFSNAGAYKDYGDDLPFGSGQYRNRRDQSPESP